MTTTPVPASWRSYIGWRDMADTGTHGLRARRGSTLLTTVGIAIGIAAMIAVVGISASSRTELIARLDALGTNLLQVRAGQDMFGESAQLPSDAPAMIRRIAPVEGAASMTKLDATVRRTSLIPEEESGGVDVYAVERQMAPTLEMTAHDGRLLDAATERLPVTVLGATAAERLGITDVAAGTRVLIADQWFAVIGILDRLPLNADIDRAALIGYNAARAAFAVDLDASAIYLRTHPEQVETVRSVLGRTANPARPNEVAVSRPSDALEARAQVDVALQTLLLGLGGVALLVGALGIANVMVISVLERRAEVGLRRALGATRRQIRTQFLIESAMLSALGGIGGVALGAGVTIAYAASQGWTPAIPVFAVAGGVVAALAIGGLAGLYPAARAARLDPAEAVRPA